MEVSQSTCVFPAVTCLRLCLESEINVLLMIMVVKADIMTV